MPPIEQPRDKCSREGHDIQEVGKKVLCRVCGRTPEKCAEMSEQIFTQRLDTIRTHTERKQVAHGIS